MYRRRHSYSIKLTPHPCACEIVFYVDVHVDSSVLYGIRKRLSHMRRVWRPRFGGRAQSMECWSSVAEGYMTLTAGLKTLIIWIHWAPCGQGGPSFTNFDFGPGPVFPAATTTSPWSGWIIHTAFFAGIAVSHCLAGWKSGGTLVHTLDFRVRTPRVRIPPQEGAAMVGSGVWCSASRSGGADAMNGAVLDVSPAPLDSAMVAPQDSGDVWVGAQAELVCSSCVSVSGFINTVSPETGEGAPVGRCGHGALSSTGSAICMMHRFVNRL